MDVLYEIFQALGRTDVLASLAFTFFSSLVLMLVIAALMANKTAVQSKNMQITYALQGHQAKSEKKEQPRKVVSQDQSPATPEQKPLRVERNAAMTFAVVISGSHSLISKFRTLFTARFGVGSGYSLVNDKNEASLIISITVNPYYSSDSRAEKVVFKYEAWSATNLSSFKDMQFEYRLQSFGGDEKRLFEQAAHEIAVSLINAVHEQKNKS